MTIIDGLLGEHAAIYRLFDGLEHGLDALASLEQLRGRLFMVAAALGPHADAEDQLLFAAVAGLPGLTPPLLAEMEAEHVRVKAALGGLLREPDLARLRQRMPDLLAAARRHFRKEETQGFPLAASALSAATLAELTQQWATRRGVTLA